MKVLLGKELDRRREIACKHLRVEEIGKRLDDFGDHTRKCDRLYVLIWKGRFGR
jgi:hypothetical protein